MHFGDLGATFPNPVVLSGALSMITENISIRSGSIVLALHNPIKIAEDWALNDRISKGRIGMSINSGWRPDDFIFQKENYKNRHVLMKRGWKN